MGKNNKKEIKGTCSDCENAVYTGEGCSICLESDEGPKVVLEDFGPGEDHMWCDGKYFV